MKTSIYYFLIFIISITLYSQDRLEILQENMIIEQNIKGGYDLWIKKTGSINSVLLTESSADPNKRLHSYSLRNPVFEETNGNEKRLIEGKFLSPGFYSLIDSTLENHPVLGESFHIFIPYVTVYGNPQNRSGEIQILDNTWLNIRSFEKQYGDYTGRYKDNPFVLRVEQVAVKDSGYMDQTVEVYKKIADENAGEAVFSKGEKDIIDNISKILDNTAGETLDLVLALDTTKSMENDMPHLKESLVPMLKEHTSKFNNFRLGILLYKDYFNDYMVKPMPFTSDFTTLQKIINSIVVIGGQDIPEAVYEALYASIHSFEWINKNRMIILVGDAPPHPRPRGDVTEEKVFSDAEKNGIVINTIILPQ